RTGDKFWRRSQGWLLDEIPCAVFERQQRFHFTAKIDILATRSGNKRLPLKHRKVERVLDNFRDALGGFRVHHAACLVSARQSQSLAKFQSRRIVFSETWSTSAMSFASSPPKNFNSTTSLLRG